MAGQAAGRPVTGQDAGVTSQLREGKKSLAQAPRLRPGPEDPVARERQQRKPDDLAGGVAALPQLLVAGERQEREPDRRVEHDPVYRLHGLQSPAVLPVELQQKEPERDQEGGTEK